MIDTEKLTFLGKFPVGSDPEEFFLNPDGATMYITNEDVATMSAIDLATRKVGHIVPVGKEPEGVKLRPDGKVLYVTCETAGEVFAIDTKEFTVLAHLTLGGRPRTVAFLPDGSKGFVPSETTATFYVLDTVKHELIQAIKLDNPAYRPMGTAMAADGKKLYLATGRGGVVLVIDTATYAVTNTIKVGARPWASSSRPTASCSTPPTARPTMCRWSTSPRKKRSPRSRPRTGRGASPSDPLPQVITGTVPEAKGNRLAAVTRRKPHVACGFWSVVFGFWLLAAHCPCWAVFTSRRCTSPSPRCCCCSRRGMPWRAAWSAQR